MTRAIPILGMLVAALLAPAAVAADIELTTPDGR